MTKTIKKNEDTIAATATRPGESAISIIRLSGSSSIKIADRIFKAKNKKPVRKMQTFSISFGFIVDKKGNVLDQAILTLMKGPKSYTREDIVEINCHGGIFAANKILELCIENGARLAEPGEFTKRAFLNGRIDLSQAEAVIEIINAKTEESMRIAAKNINGKTGEKIKQFRSRIIDVLADLEASIDFIEEDLEITPYEKLSEKITAITAEMSILVEDQKRGEIIKNGLKVVIAGKPNVGKSSLLNALAKKEKAIVTHIPGTTRDAIEEILYIEGIPVILTDTAGIRKSKNIIEKIGVQRSIRHIEESDLVIMVLDCSEKIDKTDTEIYEKIKDKNNIICLNKVDLGCKINKSEIKSFAPQQNIIRISAIEEKGIEKLEDMIKKTAAEDKSFNIEERIFVNNRQKNILKDVLKLLKSAEDAMKIKMSEEFPVSDLKIAYNLLGEIIGQKTGEEILEKIFSRFCIGK
jgi:tRNA modification GTPase